jgi:hypothetical protein
MPSFGPICVIVLQRLALAPSRALSHRFGRFCIVARHHPSAHAIAPPCNNLSICLTAHPSPPRHHLLILLAAIARAPEHDLLQILLAAIARASRNN